SGQLFSNGTVRRIALGDLDGDGDLDAVTATSGPVQWNSIWINQGGAQSGQPGTFLAGQNLNLHRSNDVGLADLDGDNDLDIFLANNFDPWGHTVWLNDGNATFSDSGQTLGQNETYGLALADLDADGDIDALAVNQNNGANQVWLNDGAAGFTAGSSFGTGYNLDLADLDNDGDQDAFIVTDGANQVWLNDGAGGFTTTGQQLGSARSFAVALGDLDGDGDRDAFVANGDVIPGGGEANQVWLNGSGGGVTPTPTATVPLPTPAPAGQTGWQIERVRNFGPDDAQTLLVQDPAGRPLLAYLDSAQTYFSFWNGLNWASARGDNQPRDEYAARLYSLYALPEGGFDVLAGFEFVGSRGGGSFFFNLYWDGERVQRSPLGLNLSDITAVRHVTPLRAPLLRQFVYTRPDEVAYGRSDTLVRTIIDAGASDPRDLDLERDSAGDLYVSYVSAGAQDELRYARETGGNWTVQVVAAAGAIQHAQLLLDSQARPHLVYYRPDQNTIEHLRLDGASWTTLPAPAPVAGLTKMVAALDSGDELHLALLALDNGAPALFYGPPAGSAWTPGVVVTGDAIGYTNLGFTITPDDVLQLTWQAGSDQDIYLARYQAAWGFTVADSNPAAALPSLYTAPGNDRVHLSYQPAPLNPLQYAAFDGAWLSETIGAAGGSFAQSSLRRDGLGLAHVSFYEPGNRDLYYARQTATGWQVELVDSAGDVGRHNELYFSNQGPVIAYWDATNQQIKMAQQVGGAWQFSANTLAPSLDAASGVLSGGWAGGNEYFVTYFDGLNEDLRLAHWAGGWQSDVVLAGQNAAMGRLNSLEIISGGYFAAVAYVNDDDDTIWFAFEDESGWHHQPAAAAPGLVNS
ncbi:MAG: VCBS repeat-containing protein, partial [Anaerolineales bacterium]|nr:VCBS repeat-containing protein [Anaerolineales bacterium]